MQINGGDIITLNLAHNFIQNNFISHVARWTRTYNPGIGYWCMGKFFLDKYCKYH